MLRTRRLTATFALLAGLAIVGCGKPSAPPTMSGGAASGSKGEAGNGSANGHSTGNGAATGSNVDTASGNGKASAGSGWKDYPDVPFVPIMTEVDGIEIPRLQTKAESLQLKGEIPADVGNEQAKKSPSRPERGDWLVVRFNSEPKTLNPIVETSAVQTYISEYVQEALARLNPETLEYEPNTAEKWVAEDAVKLSPDYKGKERRVAVAGKDPAGEASIDYPKKAGEKDADAKIEAVTSNAAGQPAGNTWIGVYPVGKIVGAPINGYHLWSDKDGKATITGLVPGKYTVRVGAEVYGTTKKNDDGSLVVTPATPGNPLHEELKSTGGESLTLAKGEWSDVQAETVYTYFLRKDVKWSDGTPYTTKDILLGFATLKNEYVDGESLRVYYEDLIECDALDEYTVRMKYRQQYFKSFEFTMGVGAFAPPFHLFSGFFKENDQELTLDKLTPDEEKSQKKVSAWGQAFGKFFNTDDRYNLAPLGTGPYRIAKWSRGESVDLERNPTYWNKKRDGYLDKLIFRFIPDNVTAFQALRAGAVDFFWNMDTEQYHKDLAGPPEWFKGKYVKAKWYSPSFSYMGYNLLRPLFQDRRVRIALSLLFDKQEFLDKKIYGDAQIVSGSQYFFGPGYDHEVKPLAYDPETARSLLAEAGWVDTDNDGVLDKDGQKFSFEYLIPQGNKLAVERAAIYQKSLKDVGIRMEVREIEWASFIDRVKPKEFDIVGLGWAQPLESDPYQIWHGSGAGAEKRGSNHVSFSDPLADEIIEQLRLTLDPKKREKYNYSLHRILDREQPYQFLYLPMDHGAYHQRFRGVKWYRVRPGFDFTEWYVPKDEQVYKN